MYSVNNYFDRSFLIKSNSYKYKIYDKYGSRLLIFSIIAFIVSIYLSMRMSLELAVIILIPYVFGLIYSTPLVKNLVKKLNFTIIQKLYNTKIITGFGWILAVVVFPYYGYNISWGIYLSTGLFFFLFVFLRHLIIDFVAFQGDLILGRDTLQTWLGVKKVVLLSYLISIISSIFFIIVSVILNKPIFLILLSNILYYILLLVKIQKTDYLISLRYEFIIDLNYFILIVIYFIIKFLPVLL